MKLNNKWPYTFLGKHHSEETKKKISLAHLSEKNAMWKADNVGNDALHEYMHSRIPKPEKCGVCNEKPPIDLANITGIYNRDPINWQWQCRGCHMKSDGRMNNLKQYQ